MNHLKEFEREKKDYTTANFVSKFMNDHNSRIRWLRGIFFSEQEKVDTIIEWMDGIEAQAYQLAIDTVLKEIFPNGIDSPDVDQTSYGWIILTLEKLKEKIIK